MFFFKRSSKRLALLVTLRKLGLGPAALTCSGKSDGGGAQVHAVLSVQAFCRHSGFTYLHTAMKRIEHTSHAEDALRWEKAFELGAGFGCAGASGLPILALKAYSRKPWLWGRDLIVALPHAHDFADAHPGCYSWLRKPPQPSNAIPVVAIHVRRGDVSQASNTIRFTSDEIVERRIKLLQECLPVASYRLYSEGDPSNFHRFADLGCELRLGGDPLRVLRELAQADILVTAKSSFSFVAGLMNPNRVVYEAFWHAPQPGWINVEDSAAIRQALLVDLHPSSNRWAVHS